MSCFHLYQPQLVYLKFTHMPNVRPSLYKTLYILIFELPSIPIDFHIYVCLPSICTLAFVQFAGPLCLLKYCLLPFLHFLSHPCPPDPKRFSSILMKVSTFPTHAPFIFSYIQINPIYPFAIPLFLSEVPLLKSIQLDPFPVSTTKTNNLGLRNHRQIS